MNITYASSENWLCQSLVTNYSIELILRYLKAFGPATISDIHWSGLTKISKVIEDLRLQLNTFHDKDG
ncbi:DNA glycosylase AlkZ-like family protein [Metabacillus halosaccharovorans]|uniref:DNA glycosylase AlkZ-like family protein n=1 Tax=Metabacillus halosaccharovorans TaxID=930124 RepID=UPI0037353C5E